MKKLLPLLLGAWPYLVLWMMSIFGGKEEGNHGLELLLLIALTVVVYVTNIVNAFTYKIEDAKKLAFWDMVIKLIHIPFYLIVFIAGVALLMAMVVPALVFVSPFLVAILAVIDFFLMLTSSAYGIHALIRAKKNGVVSVKFVMVHSILHLFFVTDVISAVIVFVKVRKCKLQSE